jgi:hypothetical protein
MISFEQARDRLLTSLIPVWEDTPGIPYVADHGLEDDDWFQIDFGAREYLVDGDEDFMIMNNMVAFINKDTGIIESYMTPEVFDRLDKMKPVKG